VEESSLQGRAITGGRGVEGGEQLLQWDWGIEMKKKRSGKRID